MDSLFSFPVGLFRPLQHAGLSRRSPDCRQSASYLDSHSASATRIPGPSRGSKRSCGWERAVAVRFNRRMKLFQPETLKRKKQATSA